MSRPAAASDALLERMEYQADPLADATIAAILGPWEGIESSANATGLLSAHADHWQRLAIVNRLIGEWQTNQCLVDWKAGADVPPEVAEPLEAYVRSAQMLPAWAEPARIARAEALFMDHGVLSCTLLFCASLPECYVVPDLSEVLHVTGQLERRTEYRIRATAAMVFPLMMRGGLTAPDGGGLAQVLKVRLIHATVRNLILRQSPEAALQALGDRHKVAGAGVVMPLAQVAAAGNMHQTLLAHGWKLGQDGLPCSQEELAYTLLTFGYVFLRGLRTLGVGLERDDEEAYLHAWNVVGHVIGIEAELMAHTMDGAAALFARMQARGRAQPTEPDVRPLLGSALMESIAGIIPLRLAKPFPALLTRHLCGAATAADIGVNGHVSWLSRAVFVLGLGLISGIDWLVRLFVPGFSLSRFFTRLVGYQLMTRFLMDQTRPLKLPQHVLRCAHGMMHGWGNDPCAPGWLNALEARLTSGRSASVAAAAGT